MEESKKFAAPSATYTTQITQPSFSAMPESHGPSHAFRMLPSDKPSSTPISSGVFSASLPGHVSTTTPASAALQPLTTDAKVSTVSSGLPGSQLGRDSTSVAFSKVEKTQFKVEGGSNGASYAMQVPGNSTFLFPFALTTFPFWAQ